MKKSIVSVGASKAGFSLIEVVLAIGIFLVTVLALVGLLGPTLQSVDEVEKTDEVSSVVNTLNAFLQNSPDIAPNSSKFNAIYRAVVENGYATVVIFRQYDANNNVSLKVGFVGETAATVANTDILNGAEMLAAGPVYRCVLTPSSVNPDTHMTDNGAGSYPRYSIGQSDPSVYPEGYFAMEVRIFAEQPNNFTLDVAPGSLVDVEPIFTYNTAVVR